MAITKGNIEDVSRDYNWIYKDDGLLAIVSIWVN